ncbi:MAG: adenine phosphoribosyltransferase [Gammaproteobacteria bacterium]|nr:adenine phosphoribosyltransferase [Gammaproteobacteria bacterium]
MSEVSAAQLRAAIRTVPDFPRPGVLFRDVTPLLADARLFAATIAALAEPWRASAVAHVAGIEARGFILGGALAQTLQAGFIPIRKRGRLPRASLRAPYALEYGSDEIEVHQDALKPGERVLLVDDLLATGGTAAAAVQLLRELRAVILGAAFIIELAELGGAARLAAQGLPVHRLVRFP